MLTVILQAGGESTRMGQDKALMPFRGIPLIQLLRDRFQELDSPILVITNQPARYEFLGNPLYKDVLPGRGALGGLLTALEIAKTPFIGLIAADLPFASPALLMELYERIEASGADALLPSSPQGIEPLHGIYRQKACLPLVRKAIQDDLWRMTAWHEWARVDILDPLATAAAAGFEGTFINLNTPAEFKAAEALAAERGLI